MLEGMDRITTHFDIASTAAEVVAGIDLQGKRAIVTGGASGIGVETARALAGAGAEVTLAVRDLRAGDRVAAGHPRDDARRHGRRARASSSPTSPASTRSSPTGTARSTSSSTTPASWPPPRRTPREGWELQFATNHLGHFKLAHGLRGALAAAHHARIVSVSSSAHFRSPVIFDDLFFRFMPYDPWAAYGQSKTANVLFAVEATRRWAADGITANSLMPGAIATNLQRHTGGAQTPPDKRKTVRAGGFDLGPAGDEPTARRASAAATSSTTRRRSSSTARPTT